MSAVDRDSLIGTVAQRLVRRVCPKCCQPTVPTPEEARLILGHDPSQKMPEIIQSVGCNDCYQTGYKGRKSIYEILPVSPNIKSLILDGGNDDAIKRQAASEGMISLTQSAIADVLHGKTTLDEITRIVDFSH